MSNFENAPVDVKATLFVTAIKLSAIVSTLSGEQLEKYNQIIAEQKENASKHLKDLLTPEELESFLKML